jgi:competence protein ComEC
MSFAATAALIAAFQALRHTSVWSWHPVARWAVALVLSSAVAGLATAPFAAAHFNRVPHFGLVANLLSVPVMGSLVMPFAVLAAILAPFGLGWVGLRLMEPGISWILGVADRVAGWEGAASHVVMPQPAVLPLFALGGLMIVLWHGAGRWLGAVPLVAAFALWSVAERPALLITEDGGLLGLMTEEGRSLSKARGAGFAASSWLENDGDTASQEVAFQRHGFEGGRWDQSFLLDGRPARHLSGRGAAEKAADLCGDHTLLIVAAAETGATGPCLMIDREMLAVTGPVALFTDADGVRIVPADNGTRLWNRARQ